MRDDGRTTNTPIGALVHWIAPAEDAPWLWEATSAELVVRGMDPAVVVGLQTLALWAGGLEPGEFMLAGQTPFVIDIWRTAPAQPGRRSANPTCVSLRQRLSPLPRLLSV
jgi:hypothetical protein